MAETRGAFVLSKIVLLRLDDDGALPEEVFTNTVNPVGGYFGGGAPGPFSTMDKVTYSTDTRTTVPNAVLSAARSYLAATGNSTSGYFGGGFPGPVSTMDKVTYATDTTAAVPGAALSAVRDLLAASSSTANAVRGTTPIIPIV